MTGCECLCKKLDGEKKENEMVQIERLFIHHEIRRNLIIVRFSAVKPVNLGSFFCAAF